jgi:hypothetical protein
VNSATLITIGCAPCAVHAFAVSGAPTMRETSALSRSTTAGGVAFGAIRPSQIVASYFGTPASASVGTSGITVERAGRSCPSP